MNRQRIGAALALLDAQERTPAMTDTLTGTDLAAAARRFWLPGHGTIFQAFCSPRAELRAAFIRELADDAANFDWVTIWTNSPVLARDPRVEYGGPAAEILAAAAVALAARQTLEAEFIPTRACRVPLLILDFGAGRPALSGLGLAPVAANAQKLGIAIALIVAEPVPELPATAAAGVPLRWEQLAPAALDRP